MVAHRMGWCVREKGREAGRALLAAIIVLVLAPELARAENITRGAVTGQTRAAGYDHPGQYLHVAPVKIADNMEPVMVHPEQDKQARAEAGRPGEAIRQEAEHPDFHHGRRRLAGPRLQRRRGSRRQSHPELGPAGARRSDLDFGLFNTKLHSDTGDHPPGAESPAPRPASPAHVR